MADSRAEGDSYGSDTVAEPVKAPAAPPSVPGSAPPLSSFASQFGAQTDKVERSIGQTNQARNDLVGWMKANPRPEPPKLAAPVAPPENKPQPSPLESFGSVASALGVMGGFLTRKPLVTALNASTQAMKALHDKNNEEFQRNYEVWKQQSEFAQQTMKWQTDQYEQLMKAHEGKASDMMTALTVQAAATKDEVLLAELRKGDLTSAEKILNDRKRLGLEFERHTLDVQREARLIQTEQHNFGLRTAEAERKRAHDQFMQDAAVAKSDIERDKLIERARQFDKTFDAKAEINDLKYQRQLENDKIKKEEIDKKIEIAEKRLAAYERDVAQREKRTDSAVKPETEIYREFLAANPNATIAEKQAVLRNAHPPRSAIGMSMQRYLDEHPNASAEDLEKYNASFRATARATGDFATGVQGRTINSFSVVANHLETLRDLAKALNSGDLRAANRIYYRIGIETGQPEPTSFEAAKIIIGPEIVKAIIGTGAALGDRDRAEKVLEGTLSPDQMEGTVGTIKTLVKGQLDSLQQQYKQTTKKDDFMDRLSPAARSMFAGMPSAGAASPAATTGAPAGKSGTSVTMAMPKRPPPVPGEIRDGYIFLGGAINDPANYRIATPERVDEIMENPK